MASFSRQFGTASPVLTMPPQPPHQAAFHMNGLSHQPSLQKALGSASFGTPVPQATLSAAPSTSRKRSRDEAAENLEADAPPPPPAQESEEEWVYGPGMTLIKKTKGYVADASSQSGTWIEEKAAAEEEARRAYASEKAMLRNSKSQRLDHGLDLNSGAESLASNPESVSPTNTSFARTDGPVVDDFTLHLGVGWRKISDDEHIQAAARGWARYIENHYPVTNAQIRLESKGLQSYLVETSEGFFLFAENLRHGRLVSQNVQGALCNLQCSPPTFDGAETLTAAESPSSTGVQRDVPPVDAEMHMD